MCRSDVSIINISMSAFFRTISQGKNRLRKRYNRINWIGNSTFRILNWLWGSRIKYTEMLPNFKNAECCSSNCVQKAIVLAVIYAVKKIENLKRRSFGCYPTCPTQYWHLSDLECAAPLIGKNSEETWFSENLRWYCEYRTQVIINCIEDVASCRKCKYVLQKGGVKMFR